MSGRIFRASLGALIAFAGLWGGAYGMHLYPPGHWASFPAFVTGFAFFIFGGVVSASALSDEGGAP